MKVIFVITQTDPTIHVYPTFHLKWIECELKFGIKATGSKGKCAHTSMIKINALTRLVSQDVDSQHHSLNSNSLAIQLHHSCRQYNRKRVSHEPNSPVIHSVCRPDLVVQYSLS